MEKKVYRRETELAYRGHHIPGKMDEPEADALYLTSAFNVKDLDEMEFVYDGGGFAYNRTNNPNRTALAEAMTYLESGEDSIICGRGMAAITTALMALTSSGDHILSDMTLYGDTITFMSSVFKKYGVDVTYVDFTDHEQVKAAIQPNTKVLYAETICNPMMLVSDIRALAEIAHAGGARLMVDNTFATSVMVRPIELGADIVVNSLTKFYNGHSDCLLGSITSTKDFIKEAYDLQTLLGTGSDAFNSWLVLRSLRTLDVRVKQQIDNAARFAAALEKNPNVRRVMHPSLTGHPQHALAKEQFDYGYGAMLSVLMADDDREKMNAFIGKLRIVRYATTLGGFRTTISHPVTSSHSGMSEDEYRRLGISAGMLRVSIGMENPNDLIEDFEQALTVYGK
ncbi:MAG TPA: PLP-dependent transferase [Clostridiales bacterium]|nr:PLP-dependent transferase [Clostridiales bacterium]